MRYPQGRVSKHTIYAYPESVIQKYKELWNPEVGDLVWYESEEFPLTHEDISDESFDKMKYLPLIKLEKAYSMMLNTGYAGEKCVSTYECYEDYYGRALLSAISLMMGIKELPHQPTLPS